MCRQSHHTMLHLLLLLSCLATCSCWPQCVQESSLTLSAVHFVSEQHLEERTVAGCIVHCLTRPGVESVMVSYSPGVLGILGDQLNCLCGQQGALDQAVLEEAAMCAVTCPGGDLSCGDTDEDLLSLYSLHSNTGLEGCLTTHAVHWDHVITLHDFEGHTVDDCHQRCSTMDGLGVSISSCGALESVSKNDVLDPSVCSIINSLRSDLYYVTCTDNSSTSAVTISTAPDYTEQYLGCVITELFQHQEMVELNLTESGGVTTVTPSVCQGLCSSMPGHIRQPGHLWRWDLFCRDFVQENIIAGPDALSVYQVAGDVGTTLALVDSQRRSTEIVMIDHVRIGLDVMLMFVCLILLLLIVAFILHKQYQQSYTEIQ